MSTSNNQSVGQQLLDVPLPRMVEELAMGIAKAQNALDENSVETAVELAEETIDVYPAITRVITDDGVEFNQPDPIEMSLLHVGLTPTFYQFSEATIEVSMDIKTKLETETSFGVETEHSVNWGVYSGSVQADFEHNRKFGKTVEGTSKMKTTLVPVTPPELMVPEIETVDNRTPPQNGGGGGGGGSS
jgi:hypothetical protein